MHTRRTGDGRHDRQQRSRDYHTVNTTPHPAHHASSDIVAPDTTERVSEGSAAEW
jgi:hypothetical protein